MKSQEIRMVDVLLLGPFMLWMASRPAQTPPWARAVLGVAGLLTITYNGENWLRGERSA